MIGVNGRGKDHIRAVAENGGMHMAAVVDIDRSVAETAVGCTKQFQTDAPEEFRDILDAKEVDAVTVATSNHWHARATIWVVQARRDVYCGKPASHSIFEGRKVVEAARKYKRIAQIGRVAGSIPVKMDAIQRLREGVIGDVYMAKGLCFKLLKTIGTANVSSVPSGVDYDILLGWPSLVSSSQIASTTTGVGLLATAISATKVSRKWMPQAGVSGSTTFRSTLIRQAGISCTTMTRKLRTLRTLHLTTAGACSSSKSAV